jgi:hypothetical protein
MEILPGVGLPVAQVGQTLEQVEARVGRASSVEPKRARWPHHEPPFDVYFDENGLARLIEVHHSERGGEQATLGGVQLTFRALDDVVVELADHGTRGRRTDIVVEFDGFILWSLLSLDPDDVEPSTLVDTVHERLVVEGVGIAPAQYWRDN